MQPPRLTQEAERLLQTDPNFRFYHQLYQDFIHIDHGIEEVRIPVAEGIVPSSALVLEAQSAKDWFYRIINQFKSRGDVPTPKITPDVLQKLDDLKDFDWTNPATMNTVYDTLDIFKPQDYDKLIH